MNVSEWKPNLIPNNKKGDGQDHTNVIKKNGGISNYLILPKKDGCRLGTHSGELFTRSKKSPSSLLVIERFQLIADIAKEENLLLEGEFYMYGFAFNQIYSFFANTDVTREDYKIKLEKALKKSPEEFYDKYRTYDLELLTTFHKSLKFWLFDGIVLDRPELVGFQERMDEIFHRLSKYDLDEIMVRPNFISLDDEEDIEVLYQEMIDQGFEGLVLTHKDHKYKHGRNSVREGTLLKMKEDSNEYDGIVLDVIEGTLVKEDVKKTVNELGRSVTSKKKDDREPSGMAKAFLVKFENVGTFKVGLKGFNNDSKKELLDNKNDYIGKHFVYTGMAPDKDFPRHAYFSHWRDEK